MDIGGYMYIYSLEQIDSNTNTEEYQKLYDIHFPGGAQNIKVFLEEPRLSHFVCTRQDGELIGAMGIIHLDLEHDGVDAKEENYQFFHLVVADGNRNQGIALGIIKMAVKFLIFIGAKFIHNHKRENVIKATVFTDLKFELIEYDVEKVDYKWNYRLDITNTNISDLIGGICEKYEE